MVPKSFSQLDIAGKINWVIEKLRPTGYKVERKGFGTINFGSKQLKGAFKYFAKDSVEESAFEALPYVLQNGVEIGKHGDHKGREYGTVTIAAPVTIDGRRGNMAVVVKQTTDNFYKVHRILTPDGAVFELNANEAEPTPAGESPETGSLATPISSASTTSIPNSQAGVNGENASPVAQTVGAEDVSAEQPRGLARTQKVTRAAQQAGKVATVADYAAAYGEHGSAMEQVYNMEGASQDAQQFASGYEVAYNWGYSGVRPEYLSRDDTRSYTGILTEAQRQRAYQNGLAAARADNKTPGSNLN